MKKLKGKPPGRRPPSGAGLAKPPKSKRSDRGKAAATSMPAKVKGTTRQEAAEVAAPSPVPPPLPPKPRAYRPHLNEMRSLVAQVEEAGAADDLSDEDRRLASSTWMVAKQLVALAGDLEAGRGDKVRTTAAGQTVGTVRKWLQDAIANFEDIRPYKAAIEKQGEELAVALRGALHPMLKEAKRMVGETIKAPDEKTGALDEIEIPVERIAGACMSDILGVVSSLGVYIADAGQLQIRSEIDALLEGRTAPAEAARDITVSVLHRAYAVSSDAVKEGAKDRLRKVLGENLPKVPPDRAPVRTHSALVRLKDELQADAALEPEEGGLLRPTGPSKPNPLDPAKPNPSDRAAAKPSDLATRKPTEK